jgi:hypothetical protein
MLRNGFLAVFSVVYWDRPEWLSPLAQVNVPSPPDRKRIPQRRSEIRESRFQTSPIPLASFSDPFLRAEETVAKVRARILGWPTSGRPVPPVADDRLPSSIRGL